MLQNVVSSLLTVTVIVFSVAAGFEWSVTEQQFYRTRRTRTTLRSSFNLTRWHKLQLNKPRSVEKFCATLIPPFGVRPQNTESPYDIQYARKPNRVYIRILAITNNVTWRGFVLQIRHDNLPVGRLFMSDFLNDSKTYLFGCRPDAGPTHYGSDTLYRFAPNNLRKAFTWWLPPTQWLFKNYNYTLHATVIKEYPTFWVHTIPLEMDHRLPHVELSLIENDPLITEVDNKKEDDFSWSRYLKLISLGFFEKVLRALLLWEPGLSRYDTTHAEEYPDG